MIATEALIDPRTGILTDVTCTRGGANLPEGFVKADVQLARTNAFCAWEVEAAGGAYGFSVRALAAPAVGEAIERYCGMLPSGTFTHASMASLWRDGLAFRDPRELVPFSAEQYQTPGFPFRQPGDDDPVLWTEGVSYPDGRPVLVPAELVWGNLPFAVAGQGQALTPVVQAGLAAGSTLEQAITNATLEVIERDSMTLCWVGRRGLGALHVSPALHGLGRGSGGNLRTEWFSFGNEFGLPVVGALVWDPATRYMSLGVSCGEEPFAVARKAFAEACQLQGVAGAYDDERSFIGQASQRASSPLKRHRRDRAYLQDYRSDFRDVMDYGCHQQLFLDEQAQALFREEVKLSCTHECTLDELRPTEMPLVQRIHDAGFDLLVKDITTSDVAPLGLHVVRVIIPRCLPNHAAGLPYLGSPRLQAALDAAGATSPRALPLPH